MHLRAVKALASPHICTSSPEPSLLVESHKYQNLILLWQVHGWVFFCLIFHSISHKQYLQRVVRKKYPDQLASEKPAYLDLHYFQKRIISGFSKVMPKIQFFFIHTIYFWVWNLYLRVSFWLQYRAPMPKCYIKKILGQFQYKTANCNISRRVSFWKIIWCTQSDQNFILAALSARRLRFVLMYPLSQETIPPFTTC